jgi:hypothetical protein
MTKILATNLYFLFGVIVFYINAVADRTINVPAGEFVLLGLVVIQILKCKSFLAPKEAMLALFCASVFILLATLLDVYHESYAKTAIRVFFKYSLFYLTILLYIILPNKDKIFRYLSGLLVGYMSFFLLSLLHGLVTSPSNLFYLKYVIPTPAVVLLFFLLHKGRLSPGIGKFLVIGFVISLLSLPLLGGRGAALSSLVGLAFYLVYRFTRPVGISYVVFIWGALLIPCITISVVYFGYEGGNPYGMMQFLYDNNFDTVSNIERTLALNYSIYIIESFPFVGVGQSGVSAYWAADFTHLTGIKNPALSPHNYYMEIAVPFGLPALALVLGVWFYVYRLMFKSVALMGRDPAIAAFACAAVGWIMLYQPVAGITRMDVMILTMSCLYGIGRQSNTVAE